MTNLHIVSTIYGSIGEITLDLYEKLKKDFRVTREWEFELPINNDILLVHFLNLKVMNQMDIFNSFKLKVLIQPIDGTAIKKENVELINCFDIIITPAEAGRNIMLLNGVTKPIFVIPNYIKDNLFSKKIYTDIEKYIPENKFIFYHESSFDQRKGISLLYEGFVRAFADTYYADKVVLIVKDLPYNKVTFKLNKNYKKQTIKLQNKFKKSPLILKFSCYLSENELKSLWNKTDCYVSLSHIEGFGIPLLRMVALNKKIVVLENDNYSGYVDYLKESNSYIIPSMQTKAEETIWLYDENKTLWAVPNISDVIKTLRMVIEDNSKHQIFNNEKYLFNNVYEMYKNLIKNELKKINDRNH